MELSEKQIKVSVCVITYNHEKYIRKCLQSILDQNVNFDFEVIVGEDCSTDGTQMIVQEFVAKYPTKFKSILHKTNVGGCDNYRAVHFAAKGEYIAHVDGDDCWHPDKIQYQIDFMDCNLNFAAVYTNALVESDSGEVLGVFSSGVRSSFDLFYLIESRNFLTSSSTLYRRQYRDFVIPTTGDFVDFQIHIRLAQCGLLGFINENLVIYKHRSVTSILASDNAKVRRLVWHALCDIQLPMPDMLEVNKAKGVFIVESILIELFNGRFRGMVNWYILLSNATKDMNSISKIGISYSLLTNISKKIYYRLCAIINRHGMKYVFYKR
jgi:glycosyltransferase involved in cell wall biosynthesis